MKILQVITSLRMGGAERLVVELSKRMAEVGDSVEVLLFDGTRTPLYDHVESAGIKVNSLAMGESAMHNPLLILKLRNFLKRNKYDIIHTHNTPCQLLTALAAPRKKLVTTEHNTDNRRRSQPVLRAFDRWLYCRYQIIVCVNEETRENLSLWLSSKTLDARMSVVPNGIDLERIEKAHPAQDMVSDNRYKILMVSAFRPEKDHMTLIRAMSLLSEEFSLYLAGRAELPAHMAIMDSCRKAARELGIGHRIHFLGLRDDVPELLAAADAVVLSSQHEGLSLSILEAMASGRPVVASDVSGIRQIVGGAGVLFPYGDAEKLAEEIKKLSMDPKYASTIARQCELRAADYDIARTVQGYRELYNSINK